MKNPKLETRAALVRKVLAVRVSGRFAALLDCILSLPPRTTHAWSALTITSDGFLLAQERGDIGFNHLIGSAEDFSRNLSAFSKVAGLTVAEIRELFRLAPLYASGPKGGRSC